MTRQERESISTYQSNNSSPRLRSQSPLCDILCRQSSATANNDSRKIETRSLAHLWYPARDMTQETPTREASRASTLDPRCAYAKSRGRVGFALGKPEELSLPLALAAAFGPSRGEEICTRVYSVDREMNRAGECWSGCFLASRRDCARSGDGSVGVHFCA